MLKVHFTVKILFLRLTVSHDVTLNISKDL